MSKYRLNVMQAKLPAYSAIAPYLKEIDALHWYCNFGPLVQRFEKQLMAHFSCPVLSTANGSSALVSSLLAHALPAGARCLMPAWTFAGSVAAVRLAGLTPYFCDVSPTTGALSPAAVEALLQQKREAIAAIVVVAPFGAPVPLRDWSALAQRWQLPVVVDAAAAFDSMTHCDEMQPCPGVSVVISLHATKVFGVGEGGLVLNTDKDWIEHLRNITNFGFDANRIAQHKGFNGKMSEYHAAVGLALLDAWPEWRARWQQAAMHYQALLAQAEITAWGQEHWLSSTFHVCLPERCAIDAVQQVLASVGIETRRWWQQGCHRQPAFAEVASETLVHTDSWAKTMLGLPFFLDMAPSEQEWVVAELAKAVAMDEDNGSVC